MVEVEPVVRLMSHKKYEMLAPQTVVTLGFKI